MNAYTMHEEQYLRS